MALSNRSSLRLNLSSSNEFEGRKSNQSKGVGIAKQNLVNLRLLNQKPDFIDRRLSLKEQSWYHGRISQDDAEDLLRNCCVGSFLVRNSEFNKADYLLSLRSVKGFIHIRIEQIEESSYTLGINNRPFESISELVYHYSLNRLPIHGIELSLLFPLKDQLL